MSRSNRTVHQIGDWLVDASAGRISRGAEIVRLDARAMRLLVHLANRPGEVVSIDELLSEVWTGVVVTPDSVYQAVASLRRLLGDDSKQPTYIATVPRLGYRMVAPVSVLQEASATPPAQSGDASAGVPTPRRTIPRLAAAVGASAILLLLSVVLLQGTAARKAPDDVDAATRSAQSIAVMPFFDLTEAMDHEPFVDGMTEELVEKLSSIPGLQVPPARSTFKFKGAGATISDVAEALNVAYVLDGSVRRSGDTLRVAARLVRVSDGFVAWSQTYDRPVNDLLMIQEDIAGEVAAALRGKVSADETT